MFTGKTPRFGEKGDSRQLLAKAQSSNSKSQTSNNKKAYNISLSSDDEESPSKRPNPEPKDSDDEWMEESDIEGEADGESPYQRYNDYVFESNEENILDDSLYIYDYLNKVIGIEEKNIIIFGRSMGSGPATHVASKRNPACLLLMSAFKSIRAIAQDQAGSILQYLIQDRFRNVEKISSVKSPTFLIHGMKDKLIACTHS